MKKLRDAGLFGGDMVVISGALAKRYNDCLELLGVEPTGLKTFSIDGMGWSPEIAVEKKNNYYLNNGPANVNALLLSPGQEGLALHLPSHSFDRDVLRTVFSAYRSEIGDITKDAALVVHLEQNMDALYEAFDLLQYQKIEVRFKILYDLDQKQLDQGRLIRKFLEKNNFIDRNIHMELLKNAKENGDLRGRKLSLDSIHLEINSFYSRAFGGVFVLKDFIKPILIFEDEQEFSKCIENTSIEVDIYSIQHAELLPALERQLILEKDFKKAVKTDRYHRIKNHLFVQSLQQQHHNLDEILNSHFLFKKYLNELDLEVQKKIMGMDRYVQKSIVDKGLDVRQFVGEEYYKALHKPHSSLPNEQQQLIWKLLAKIMPVDPVHLYWYDKDHFYSVFPEWDETYQSWVIQTILEQNKTYETTS